MKKILVLVFCLVLLASLSACNRQVLDTTYRFNYAVIVLLDRTHIEGDVSSWRDYSDSDMIQVTVNGVTYYTHSSNVLLEVR